MAYLYPPYFDQVILGLDGQPAAGGNLYAYFTGTSVAASLYATDGTTLAWPLPIGSDGRVEYTLSSVHAYRLVAKDALGGLIFDRDKVWATDGGTIPTVVTSSDIQNVSGVSGGTVTAALNTLDADKMDNPMTTLGDLIVGGSSGTPTRVGVGAPGTILTIVGGVPAWSASSAGVTSVNGDSGPAVVLDAADVGAEPALGNPFATGYVLSSTDAGVRSWIAIPSDSVTSVFGKTGAVANIADAAGWLHNNGSGTFAWSTPTAADVGALPSTTTHGDLVGLADDDHLQYALNTSNQYAVTNYTFLGTEPRNSGYAVNATAAPRTVTIDADLFSTGYEVTICKWDSSANSVTLDAVAGNTIDGAQTYVLTKQYQAVTLCKDGANTWKVMSVCLNPSWFEPAIAAGTTSQYWRGDKSFQTLDATAVGLGNVTNNAQVTGVTAGDTTITIGGTSTAPTVKINLANANTWTASQTFRDILAATDNTYDIGTDATRHKLIYAHRWNGYNAKDMTSSGELTNRVQGYYTSPVNNAYNGYCSLYEAYAAVGTGVVASGQIIAVAGTAKRGEDPTDAGQLGALIAFRADIGTKTGGGAIVTDLVTGLSVYPAHVLGTITALKAVHLPARTGAATITNYWAISQEDSAAKNQFAGQVICDGAFTANGNVQLGDAVGDTLTVWPSAITWSGNPTHSGTHTFSGQVTAGVLTAVPSASVSASVFGVTITNPSGFSQSLALQRPISTAGSACGRVSLQAYNASSAYVEYGRLGSAILDNTASHEYGTADFAVIKDGAATTIARAYPTAGDSAWIVQSVSATGTGESATLAFRHRTSTTLGGKIVSRRFRDYSSAANQDAVLDLYSTINGVDILALTLGDGGTGTAITMPGLAGTGSRSVVADANGLLSATGAQYETIETTAGNLTVAAGTTMVVYTGTGGHTITFPAAAATGRKISVDHAGSGALTISKGGDTFQGAASIAAVAGNCYSLYDQAANAWRLC